MNFTFLTGDTNWKTYGGSFVSKRLNNGEFDYRLVMEVAPLEDEPKYGVWLSVVAPSVCPEKDRQAAMQSFGMDEEDLQDFLEEWKDMARVEILHSYGIKVPVRTEIGNNLRKLMQAARKEADQIETLFGFYMDCPYNALGSTGWDILAGNLFGRLVSSER